MSQKNILTDREGYVNWINTLEERYPVNKWQIRGVHVWPMIKVQLIINWSKAKNKKNNSPSKYELVTGALKGASEFFRSISQHSNSTNELYCVAPHFRYDDGKQLVNRYYNGLISGTTNLKGFYIFDYGTASPAYKQKVDYPDKTFFLGNIKFFALALRELKWRSYDSNSEWEDYQKFTKEVSQVVGKAVITRASVTKQFVYIDMLKNLYKPLLKRNKVSVIYILCYYVSEMYAMNLAAAELGIPTWDMQHGGQGEAHVAYANYNVAPAEGYKLLPKNFWCWDNASAAVIAKWTSKQNYHGVMTKGNPWIDFCLSKYALEGEPANQKVILYTLQPTAGSILESYILKAIVDTPTGYVWWLRLHPRQLERKDELITLLAQHNVSHKVEIEKAMQLPLPAILSQCFVHISKYSGSILEAWFLKKKTIIISETGIECFPDVAKSNLAALSLNEDSNELLLEILST